MDDKNNKNVPQPTATSPVATEQTAPAPSQPVPPVPQPQQPLQQGVPMQPKKGLSKGALWGIIGGSIGLIVIVVGIVLAVIFLGGPSKADYQEAAKTLKEFDGNSLNSALKSSNADNAKKLIEEAVGRADSMMKKLDSSKIMRDEETKKSFGEYKTAYEKVRPNMLAIASLIGDMKDFSKKCSPSYFSYIGKPADEVRKLYDEKMSGCYQLLDNITKSEQKEVQDFGKQMKEYYKALGDFFVARANKDYSVQAPRLSSGRSNPLSKFAKKIQESNLQKHEKDFVNLVKEKAEK